MIAVQPGQRWINHARPELGLGMVVSSEGRTVTLRFGEDDRDFVFALESAPLSRIRFAVGEVVRTADGASLVIEGVEERDGIIIYSGVDAHGEAALVPEIAIAATQSFNRPAERLLHGHIDEDRWFKLRLATMSNRQRLYRDSMWGLLGGRTALLPHQLYVAHEVARRHAPRVLLADEVGLGKTVEAGLIAHYQLSRERIRRVLVVVPESLVHQWLVEMGRRFNLRFSVYDAERCDAVDDSEDAIAEAVNPFLEDQLIIVSREFLTGEPRRREQCLAAGWDLAIVDEAHHLHTDDPSPSSAYRVVEALAKLTPAVLLLTGTPRQMGLKGHFSRLRLLDPLRYHDPDSLDREHRDFEPLADLVDALSGDRPLDAEQRALLEARDVLGEDDTDLDDADCRERLIDRLLDRFGTGRVMFRNTRAAVGGFPRRRVSLHSLDEQPGAIARADGSAEESLYPERRCIAEDGADRWAESDPRVAWLEDWLHARPEEKALVICADRGVASALCDVVKRRSGVACAAFHEGLGLVERDRAAAWFSDPDHGCQALMCSEIGSEGRNFQFAHHLVLFDLPRSADLLEQRIGRLDRIGRTGDVSIHVACPSGSPMHRLFRWFHEALDAFERVGSVNQWVYEQVSERLDQALCGEPDSLEELIDASRTMRLKLEAEMGRGRDRLLEYHSCRAGRARRLVEAAALVDQDRSLRDWIDKVCGCYDIVVEDYRRNSIVLRPGERLTTPVPGLPDEGLAATFDRNTALENEDLQFLTWEHPLVGALGDLILNTERGNATICGLRHESLPRGRLAVECIFVLSAGTFSQPELSFYIPPLVVAEIYDQSGARLRSKLDHDTVNARWVPLKYKAARQIVGIRREVLSRMLESASAEVEGRAGRILSEHAGGGIGELREELSRLRHLKRVNPAVREDEINHYASLIDAAEQALRQPRVRLDALRVLVGL